MSRWPTEDHLVSYLHLAPKARIRGGKVINQERQKVRSRTAEALRMAATALHHSNSYLGARFRQFKARLGGPKSAIKAMAAHLARLIYRMLKQGEEYVRQGLEAYEKKYHERRLTGLKKSAASLGFKLIPTEVLTPAVS